MTDQFETFTGGAPISFANRLIGSESFNELFRTGMALVEETASYLDGPGRDASRTLNRAGSLVYATESMRLTTRLMQLASWLLLQRAVNEGEMTTAQAGQEKNKVNLAALSSATTGPGWEELPNELKDLIARSVRLQTRVQQLDKAMSAEPMPRPANTNPVNQQLDRLAAAFGA
ncbi:regulator of CtrA degradation [Breoghania corrubedonensis]|uniref:Regulator of CtrA degradation n=1 Tax=Breoghania corrubedonensis TaxID=665038 RepID=A0A2T5V7B4_9HYPH|nr:DUF1465 family protein [Breoghania corrubedonensis]PTW59645.1 regulator of CtrA degradation [Breoghania corrubedonensis]